MEMQTISYRVNYTGLGDPYNSHHEYSHLKKKDRICVNDNYEPQDSISENSSISYHVRTYSNPYQQAIPYDE